MRNSLGTYLCDWCRTILIVDEQERKYCSSSCRNNYARHILKKGNILRKRIQDMKLRLSKLEKEYVDWNKSIPKYQKYRHKERQQQKIYYFDNRETIIRRRRDIRYERKLSEVRRNYEKTKQLPLNMSQVWISYGLQ